MRQRTVFADRVTFSAAMKEWNAEADRQANIGITLASMLPVHIESAQISPCCHKITTLNQLRFPLLVVIKSPRTLNFADGAVSEERGDF